MYMMNQERKGHTKVVFLHNISFLLRTLADLDQTKQQGVNYTQLAIIIFYTSTHHYTLPKYFQY